MQGCLEVDTYERTSSPFPNPSLLRGDGV